MSQHPFETNRPRWVAEQTVRSSEALQRPGYLEQDEITTAIESGVRAAIEALANDCGKRKSVQAEAALRALLRRGGVDSPPKGPWRAAAWEINP